MAFAAGRLASASERAELARLHSPAMGNESAQLMTTTVAEMLDIRIIGSGRRAAKLTLAPQFGFSSTLICPFLGNSGPVVRSGSIMRLELLTERRRIMNTFNSVQPHFQADRPRRIALAPSLRFR